MDLPQTYIDLATASEVPEGTFVNIIGVVVDMQPPVVVRSGQHMFTFRLLDRKLQGALRGEEGLMVRFFKENPSQIPKIRSLGDVVLIHSAKTSTYSGQRVILSNFQTEYLVFAAASIPELNFSIAFQDKQRLQCYSSSSPRAKTHFNLAEQSYVMHLKHEMTRAVEDRVRVQENRRTRPIDEVSDVFEPQHKRPRGLDAFSGPKFKRIEELRDRVFADICVLVVKKSHENYGVDLYVTDYTTNEMMRFYPPPEEEDKDLQRDGDEYGHINNMPKKPLPGPYGHQILKVNLKRPHAEFAKNSVQEGDCVLLRNVKVRLTTWSGVVALEGDMWPDQDSSQQVNVRQVKEPTHPVVMALLARKEKYDNGRIALLKRLQGRQQQTEQQQPKSKREKKKEERREKKKRKAQQEAEAGAESEQPSLTTTTNTNKNPHIRCSHTEVPLTPLSKILDPTNALHTNTLNGSSYTLPFINARYRAHVRVVDFSPNNLEDFALPVEPSSSAEQDQSSGSIDWPFNSTIDGTPTRYEWHFSLLLEEATPSTTPPTRVRVQLHHEEAQFLLGNDVSDPEDLRSNPSLLAKLREKLFLLWGNLEEKGEQEELSNLPFECCLMEYGITVDEEKADRPEGWKRMYAMFGTTIL